MNRKRQFGVLFGCLALFGTAVAMPSRDQFRKVFPIVQELMADDIAAVRAGTMSPERAAENALKSASDTSLDEASRYLFLQAAFANYVKAANFDKAVGVVDMLKTSIKDVPDAALVEFISKQLKYVPREHGGKLYALVQGVRMRSTMTQQLSEYEAEAKKKPADTIAWSRVGNCAVALNDWAKALAAFSKADGKLAEIAALELKGGDVDAKKIADFWWSHRVLDNDFANSSDMIEQAIKAHAAGWYRKAIASGTVVGVQLQLVNKRIADFASEEDSIVESSNRRVVELGVGVRCRRTKDGENSAVGLHLRPTPSSQTSQTPQTSQPPQTPRNVQTIRFDLPGGQMMELVKCKGGTFTMGRKGVKEADSLVREHKVELTYDFLIATVPVSVRQYEGVMGGKASLTDIERQICEKFDGNMAICMKSPEATAYCETLNRKLCGKIPSGMVFRLPTEAEWEYAFRAGGQEQNDPLYDNLYRIERDNALLMHDDELRVYQCTTDEMMEMLDAKGLSREKLLDMVLNQYGEMIKKSKGFRGWFDRIKQNRIATNWWAEYCRRENVFRIVTGHGFRRNLGKPIIFRKTNAWGLAADFDTLELTMDRIPYSPGNFAATIIKDEDVEDASIGKGAIAYADFERDPFRMVKTWNHPPIMCGPCGKNIEFRDSPFRVVIGPQLKPIEQKDPQMVEKDAQPPQAFKTTFTTFDLGGGVKLEMAKCPAGKFTMGRSGEKAKDSLVREHQVELTYPFQIATLPITIKQYETVVGKIKELNPVERQVSDAMDGSFNIMTWIQRETDRNVSAIFCEALNKKFKRQLPRGQVFRLPTEAEWEYAIRAGGRQQDDEVFDNLYDVGEIWEPKGKKYYVTFGECLEMLDEKGLSAEKICESLEKTGVYRKMSKPSKDAVRLMLDQHDGWTIGMCLSYEKNLAWLGPLAVSDRRRNAWGLGVTYAWPGEYVLDTLPKGANWWEACTGGSPDKDRTIGKDLIAYGDTERNPYREHLKKFHGGYVSCGLMMKGIGFGGKSLCFRVVLGPELKPIEQKGKDAQMVEKDAQPPRPAQPPQAFKTTFTTFDLGGGVKLEMAKCPAGKFTMGRPGEKAKDSLVREHQVELTYPFQIATLPITIKQYETVVGKIKELNPVERQVSDALDGSFSVSAAWRREKGQDVPTVFCEALNKKFKRQLPRGQVFRLPTEAEWEYAMRVGGRQQDDAVFDHLYEGVELSDYERRAYFVTFGESLEMLDKKGLPAENIYELLVKTGIYQKMSEKGKDKVGLLRKHDGWGVFGWCLACEHPWLGRPVVSDRRRNAWGLALVDTGLGERVLDSIPRGSDWYWVEGSSDKDKTIGKGLIAYADIERDPYREYLKKFCEGRIVCSAFNKGVVFGWDPCFRVVIGPKLKPMRGGE